MSIEKGSKWLKDGEVVEVLSNEAYRYNTFGGVEILSSIVIFWQLENEKRVKVLTDSDFLEQYKPYEPVYEWQWAYITNSLLRWHISNYMTEEEFKTWKCGTDSSLEYKRLDFTKRERE